MKTDGQRDIFLHLFVQAASSKALHRLNLQAVTLHTATVSTHPHTDTLVPPVCEWSSSSQVNRVRVVKVVCAQSYRPSLPDRLASNRGQPRDGGGPSTRLCSACRRGSTLEVLNTPLTLCDRVRKSLHTYSGDFSSPGAVGSLHSKCK